MKKLLAFRLDATEKMAANLAVLAVLSLVAVGCGAATPPAASPTVPAKADTGAKAAEPTKAATAAVAPTAQPTVAPAKKVDFPAGRPISLIVTMAAGSPTDITARVFGAAMEKALGVPVQIVNKPGASGQTGTTEIVKAKPDGYTIGTASFLSTVVTYLDQERKAGYTRKDFCPIALYSTDTQAVVVRADGPYKTAKDLIEAAKAKPETVKAGTAGIMTNTHLGYLSVEQVTGAKFAYVHFDGGGPATTAMLGGHVDTVWNSVAGILPQVRSGQVRVVGIPDKAGSKYLPDVRTFEQQGYPVYSKLSNGICGPAGIPQEVVDILAAAAKKAVESPEYQAKMEEIGSTPTYLDPTAFDKYWTEEENRAKGLIEMAKKATK